MKVKENPTAGKVYDFPELHLWKTYGMIVYRNIVSNEIVYGPVSMPRTIEGNKFISIFSRNDKNNEFKVMAAVSLKALNHSYIIERHDIQTFSNVKKLHKTPNIDNIPADKFLEKICNNVYNKGKK